MQGTSARPKSRILIAGSTTSDGVGLVLGLAATDGFLVRTLTREPEIAARLESAGVEVVPGDLEDRASIRAALHGCQLVFGTTDPGSDGDRELPRGRNLINAVAGSEVDYFVLATRNPQLEAYARSLELPSTFVQVAAPEEQQVQIDANDLSTAVAGLFEQPAAFVGRRITLKLRNHTSL